MNIAVIGSRTYRNLEQVRGFIRGLSIHDTVISGGAKGVDRTAEDEARRLGMKVISIIPEWDKYGKRAGLIRNNYIIEKADFVAAFWDGISKGTKYTIDTAKKKNVKIKVFKQD